MPINVNNPEADALTCKFAQLEGVGITEADRSRDDHLMDWRQGTLR